jgi:NTE family protein
VTSARDRGVVLGGGGVAGIGWQLGLLSGLAEDGLDVRLDAGLFVGTSAGATVAAQITSGLSWKQLLERFGSPDSVEQPIAYDLAERRRFLAEVEAGAVDEIDAAARLGRMALTARTVSEVDRLAIIAARLPVQEWPSVPLRIVAVNAQDGRPVVFDRTSGVPLADAVAASCAVPGVWPPVTIAGDRYIDGGARSYTNADFAAGCGRVLVILPLEPTGRIAAVLDRELAELQESAEVLLVRMDERCRRAMGSNPLDPSTRHAMVAAGRGQSGDIAIDVAAFWKLGPRSVER